MGTGASVSARSIRSRLEQEVESENEITDAQAAELEALYKSLISATDGATAGAEGDNSKTEEEAYAAVKAKYCEFVAKETHVALRELPDAIDAAVFVEAKWPLIVDPSGQAARFLQCVRHLVQPLHSKVADVSSLEFPCRQGANVSSSHAC